ncbi:MAG: DUF971 domain-containing protein, partial [Candidatus Hydrogenedentota bacterium]
MVDPAPSKLKNVEDRELEITWDDGVVTTALYRDLRAACPCAACVNEWTGERTLDPAAVNPAVKPASVSLMGNYAVKFEWNDGHD